MLGGRRSQRRTVVVFRLRVGAQDPLFDKK